MIQHIKKELLGKRFEREVFELIKLSYPDDEVELRHTENGKEVADILYKRNGVKMGIEVKLRRGVAITANGSSIYYLGGNGKLATYDIRSKIFQYTQRFPFVYLVSNIPVFPQPFAEFELNGSICFASEISDLQIVMKEVVRRIDSNLSPREKKIYDENFKLNSW